ncbi:hypothetical protein PMAYCL1PPCAC_25345, partial [Pristionchus mayeri]
MCIVSKSTNLLKIPNEEDKKLESSNLNNNSGEPWFAEEVAEMASRFDFKLCSLHAIVIDESILDMMQRTKFTKLDVKSCKFDEYANESIIQRFLTVILEDKPTSIKLNIETHLQSSVFQDF